MVFYRWLYRRSVRIICLTQDLFRECDYKLRSWFTTEQAPDIDAVSLGEKVDVVLAAEDSRLYKYEQVLLSCLKKGLPCSEGLLIPLKVYKAHLRRLLKNSVDFCSQMLPGIRIA